MTDFCGEKIRLHVFGASHAPAIGFELQGVPAGEAVDPAVLQVFMDRRAPGRNAFSTARKEADVPVFESGITGGKTDGGLIRGVIANRDTRSRDYEDLRYVPRPGHADYPAYIRYGEERDFRGGGVFSARLTAPLCAAGGILLQILARKGVRIEAHLLEAAGIRDRAYDPVAEEPENYADSEPDFPVHSAEAGRKMQEAILQAKEDGDSVGGIVECRITGLPAGLGEPLYGSFEGRIAQAVFGIPAVKGIEFGAGFEAARLRGSENNDPYYIDKNGCVRTKTNHHGGILGGLTSGMPVIFRAAFKPTPSIAAEQDSVDLRTMQDTRLQIRGRHDPCVAVRAVPCVIAAAAVAAADILFVQ